MLAGAIFLTIYDANLWAILSTTVVITKPFESFDDINAKISNKKATLLLSSFSDIVYETINYTKTPQFEALRNALAANPPRLVMNHK